MRGFADARPRSTSLASSATALSSFAHERQTVSNLAQASATPEHGATLTRERNKAGAVSLIDLLDVERLRLQTEQSLAQAQVQLTNDFISLQKALGLGCFVPTITVASE
ncbi:hypothetical protein [Bradyrhizobium cenepequi]